MTSWRNGRIFVFSSFPAVPDGWHTALWAKIAEKKEKRKESKKLFTKNGE
jgi:hypothetical protein